MRESISSLGVLKYKVSFAVLILIALCFAFFSFFTLSIEEREMCIAFDNYNVKNDFILSGNNFSLTDFGFELLQ